MSSDKKIEMGVEKLHILFRNPTREILQEEVRDIQSTYSIPGSPQQICSGSTRQLC